MKGTGHELDQLLEREFARAFEPVADDGFSAAVVRRVRRRGRVRILALSLAGSIGLALAFVPLMQVAAALNGFVPILTDGWRLSSPGKIIIPHGLSLKKFLKGLVEIYIQFTFTGFPF